MDAIEGPLDGLTRAADLSILLPLILLAGKTGESPAAVMAVVAGGA